MGGVVSTDRIAGTRRHEASAVMGGVELDLRGARSRAAVVVEALPGGEASN
jgi:hypothetical protein